MKSLLRQSLILLSLALLPAVGQAVYYREKVSWQTPVAASEMVTIAQARSADAIWIDARPQEEFEREHQEVDPPLRTREEGAYYRIFAEQFGEVRPRQTLGRFATV